MSQSWANLSEITAGCILHGRIDANCVRAEMFMPPFDLMVKYIKATEKWTMEDVINKVGFSTVQTATEAFNAVSENFAKTDWVKMLEMICSNVEVADELEKMTKALRKGEQIDGSKLVALGSKMDTNGSSMMTLDQIQPGQVPFMKSGFKTLDAHLGGIPKTGLIVVGGMAGTGKSSWLMRLAWSYTAHYKKKKSAVFTLEMTAPEYRARFDEVVPEATPEHLSRMITIDEMMNISELVNKASRIPNLGFVGIDFADQLVRGDINESEMGIVYKACTALAKQLRIPVVLLSALSRTYQGGIPRPTSLRYTSMAEYLGWLILMLYSPDRDYYAEEKMMKSDLILPVVSGRSYIVAWKCRGGFRVHPGPGAIQINWKGETGWSKGEGKWFDLTKGNNNDDED